MKELLIRLRDQIKDKPFLCYSEWDEDGRHQGVGLCFEADNVQFTDEESMALEHYIHRHRPLAGSPHFDANMQTSAWYWEKGAVAPRVAWLDDEIDKFD